jgi:hypothetical protein
MRSGVHSILGLRYCQRFLDLFTLSNAREPWPAAALPLTKAIEFSPTAISIQLRHGTHVLPENLKTPAALDRSKRMV